MLDHLIAADEADFVPEILPPKTKPVPVTRATTAEHVQARIETRAWLDDLDLVDDAEVVTEAQRVAATQAFTALTTNTPVEETHQLIQRLDTPPAVQHLVALLTAYDWEFVDRAKEIRNYAVTRIMEETTHRDAKIRLRALELLGKVTEVALFTERVEVKKTAVTDEELDRKIQEKMKSIAQLSDAVIVGETKRDESGGNDASGEAPAS